MRPAEQLENEVLGLGKGPLPVFEVLGKLNTRGNARVARHQLPPQFTDRFCTSIPAVAPREQMSGTYRVARRSLLLHDPPKDMLSLGTIELQEHAAEL